MAKRKQTRRKDQGSPGLHELDIAALNRAFYGSDPAGYFHRRLQVLLALAASSEAERRAETVTHKFGKIEITIPSISDEEDEEDDYKRFVLVEAEMLVHHAAETLLRMFIAHSGTPQVPWIEMSKLRGPGELKRRLKAMRRRSGSKGLRDEIGHAFLGHGDIPAHWDDDQRAKHEQARNDISEYLDYFTGLLLEREQSYNAVKHGLAMQAGEPAIKVGDIEELSAKGPAISHLDHRRGEEGHSEWVVSTTWIPLELDLSLAHIGARLLSVLWEVARIRYAKWPIPEGGLSIPSIPLSEIRKAAYGEDPQVVVHEVAFPPAMFSPPGSGVDALISKLDGDKPKEQE